MKERSIFGLMVSLAVLGTGLATRQLSATATPAPIFRPLIRDIQNQLPRRMIMRLPASIPSLGFQVYPYIERDNDYFTVQLYVRPDCTYHACYAGSFSVSNSETSRSGLREPTEACVNSSYINLTPTIRGIYTNLQCGGSGDGTQSVSWEQDGMVFSVALRANVSRTQIINVAISMINEPPIYDIATANSRTTASRSASSGRQTRRSSNSGQQTTTGRSLLVAGNTQSIRGITVPPAEKSPSRLADGYGFFLDKPNAITLNDGTFVYSFDVYNLGYADGVIEVYDSRNNLIEVRGIEGFRNPATNLYAFPVEGVNKLFRLATEGYGILDLRNPFGRAKKTEIRNIAIPPGGRLILTKNSERALIYNQATFVMGVLADSVLSKFPSGDNSTLKTNILSSLVTELQKERVGSLLRDGMLLTAQDSRRAFANQNWIEEQNLSKVMEIGSKVLAQELLKYGVERTVVEQLVLGKKISFWVTAAETVVQGSNAFLQWLDLEHSRKWEQDGEPFGIPNDNRVR